MKKIGIPLKGFKLKDGKLVKSDRHLDVASRIRQRSSKRVKPVKPVGK